MIACTAKEIAEAVHGTLLQNGAVITGVSTDSRKVGAGELFIPLRGERFDGHVYLESALQAGAAGCLTSEMPSRMQTGKSYILVDDTRLALRDLASWYRGRFTIPVVQITGSAGKTTTKQMVAAVLGAHFNTLRTEANYNNDIGTPQTLLRLLPVHEAAVIETGMNHFGEIDYLSAMVRPDFALITNIGDAHIENLGGTREGILQAKCEIFTHLAPDGIAVLNGDDPLLSALTLPFETVFYGKGANCGVRVRDIVERGIDGISCTVSTEKNVYQVNIPAAGGFMIYPTAAAIAIAERMGLRKDEILRGIAAYESVGSRMKVSRMPGGRVVIDDSYNANPQAMEEALRNLSLTVAARRVAVLGDMGELGELSAQAHRHIGELTRQYGFDAVIAIGEKAKCMAEQNEKTQWFASQKEAMPFVKNEFTEGTAVLIKASHAMEFHKIAEELEQYRMMQ